MTTPGKISKLNIIISDSEKLVNNLFFATNEVKICEIQVKICKEDDEIDEEKTGQC